MLRKMPHLAAILLTVSLMAQGCLKDENQTSQNPPPSASNPGGKEAKESASTGIETRTQPSSPHGTAVAPAKTQEMKSHAKDSTDEMAESGGNQDSNGTQSGRLQLEGLSLDMPDGWVQEVVERSPMGPVAVLQIKGEAEEIPVRITHFPNMKGMDNMNLQRWAGMVKKPDGSPSTPSDAKIIHSAENGVAVTIFDLSGTVGSSMGPMDEGASNPESRLVAAILDHPKGPHFVRVVASQNIIESRIDEIYAFLNSGEVE